MTLTTTEGTLPPVREDAATDSKGQRRLQTGVKDQVSGKTPFEVVRI